MVYYPPKDVSEFDEMNDTLNGTRYLINDYIVGTIYCSVSSFYLMSYILCLYMICSDKGLIKKPYYRIVIHMGATDLMQLTFNGIAAGSFTLKGSTDFVPNKICGGLMNFCWVIFCAMAHLLALNRLVQVYASKTTANRIFSLCNTRIYLCSIWIYGVAWFICYMTPYISVLYSVESYDWNYSNNEVSLIFYWGELIQDTFHAACMVIWYSLIFIKLKLKLHGIQNVQINEEKKELRVLLQAFIVCFMIIITCVGFFVIQQFSQKKWARFASNLTWITCSGSNCFVYFLFDGSVKRKLWDKLLKRTSPSTV